MTSAPPSEPAADEGPRLPFRAWLVYVALSVVVVAVMLPAVFGPFIFDDQPLIFENPYVHGFEHWRRWLSGSLWDTNHDPIAEDVGRRGYWRPAILASYAWDWSVGGGSPIAFHVTNIAVHAVNVVLLFIVLRRWCRSEWAALAGGLLFAVHPVQTEPVAWIAGRTDSLCVLGMLVTVLGLRKLGEGQRTVGWVLQVFGVLLAFGAKEMAVTLPALVFVERWTRDEGPLSWSRSWRSALPTLPFVGLSLLFLAIGRLAVSDTKTTLGLTASNRVPLVFEALGRYVKLLLWPADTTLGQATLYGDEKHQYLVHWGLAGLGFGACAVAATLIARNRLTRPRAALAGLLACGLLAPVSQLFWLGYVVLVSPRFLYAPLLGVAFLVGLGVEWARRRWSARGLAALAGLLLVALAATTFARASDFASEQAFWQAEIGHCHHYPPAQEFFVVRELKEQRTRSALRLAQAFFASNLQAGFAEAANSDLITHIAEGVLQATPDTNADTLRQVERWCVAVSSGSPAELQAPELGVKLTLSGNATLMLAMKSRRRLLLLMAAEAESRVGDDVAARQHVDELLLGCKKCWSIADTTAIVLARAGDLGGALELVRRAEHQAPPGQLAALRGKLLDAEHAYPALASGQGPLVSSYYASLGAFGRAFQAAKPALRNPRLDGRARFTVAELALRAGDVDAARHLTQPELSDAEFHAWAAKLEPPLRWRELEPAPDVWLPDTRGF